LLPRPSELFRRHHARSHQIAHGLMGWIGDPYWFEFTGTIEPGKHDGVAPIRLDVVAWPDRRFARGYHSATMTALAYLTVYTITARTGFVTTIEPLSFSGQSSEQEAHVFRRVRYRSA
jgi:hypothetical protein